MSAPARPRKAAAKRAPKKAAPTPPEPAAGQPAAESAGFEPLRIGEREPEPVELVTLFSIDDVDYKIPKSPSPQAGLRFLRQAQDPQIGTVVALSNLVVEVLGPDNLLALEQSPKTSREDIRDIFRAVRRHVLGPEGDVAMEKILQGAADPS